MYARYRLRGIEPEERVLLVVGRHPLVLLRTALPPLALLLVLGVLGTSLARLGDSPLLALLAPAGVIAAPWLIWIWADWRADVFVLTEKRVLWLERTPLLSERRWEAPLSGIQNVAAISRGPVWHVLGCADLVLDTASRGVQRLYGMRRAHEAADRIMDAQAYTARKSVRLRQLRVAMGLAPEVAPTGPETPAVLVWRRHRWLLVRGLLRPAAVAVAGLALSAVLDSPPVLAAAFSIALLWTGWAWEDWRNDELVAMPNRVVQTKRSPLSLHQESWQASLEKVQDISYDIRTPLAQLLDYGTVRVQTAGDGQDFELEGVPHPREVSAELNRRLQASRKVREKKLLREVETTVEAVLRAHGIGALNTEGTENHREETRGQA